MRTTHPKVKTALARAKKDWGPGWYLLSPDLRSAILCRAMMSLLNQTDTEALAPERRAELLLEWHNLIHEALTEEP